DQFKKDNRRPDGRGSWCKACTNKVKNATRATPEARARVAAYNRERVAESRAWLWAEKSHPCERCGNTYHPVAMQFDHLPGFEKSFTLNMNKRIEDLRAERVKCQLLCANCHHIVTWERKTGNSVPLDWSPEN